MTAVMVPAAVSGGSGGDALAWNNRGRSTITPGSTATIVSFVAGTHRLRGFLVEGEGDAFVWIEVDGTPLEGMAARKSIVKDAYLILPNPETYASSSSIVALKVTNSSGVSSTFEGVVFGE